jgi:hypothetical protein
MRSSSVKAWVGVVSRAHVLRGVQGGFAQLCHGRQAPLRKMQAGDILIYYSPTTELRAGEPLRAFTAIGRIADEHVRRVEMEENFRPFRRDVHYFSVAAVSLASLRGQLQFILDNENWGLLARRGHFEIGLPDMERIACAMGVR